MPDIKWNGDAASAPYISRYDAVNDNLVLAETNAGTVLLEYDGAQWQATDVDVAQLGAESLRHTANQDVPQSVTAGLTGGLVVAQRPGTGVASFDPNELGAAQAVQDAVIYLEANGGGTVHIPTVKRDGANLVIGSQVSTDDADREPISFNIPGERGVSPDTGETTLRTNVSSGAAFRVSGDVADDSQTTTWFHVGSAFGQNATSSGLVEFDTANALVSLGNISGYTGDVITVTNRSFDGFISAQSISGSNGTTRPVVFTAGSNGTPRDWGVNINCAGTDYDVHIRDDASSGVRVSGHYEGHTGRASIDLGGGGTAYVSPQTLIDVSEPTGGARHGIYADGGEQTLLPARIGPVDGDGIHIDGGAHGPVGVTTNFASGIGGVGISVSNPLANADFPLVVPFQEAVGGAGVSYPSGPWPDSLRYSDGTKLLRTGTTTVAAGATEQIEAFGDQNNGAPGRLNTDLYITGGTGDAAVSVLQGYDTGNTAQAVYLKEELGTDSVDVSYRIRIGAQSF